MACNSVLFPLLTFCFMCSVESLLLPIGWTSHNKNQTSAQLSKSFTKCIPSDTARGDCLVCICSTDGIFACRGVKCVKPVRSALLEKQECKSNMTYKKDHTVCKCSHKSRWISENCRQIFSSLQSDKTLISSYLKSNVTCNPNALYLIDCNICQCDHSGYVQGSSCTNRYCKTGSKADACTFGDIQRTRDELCICSDVNYYIDTLCIKINRKQIQEIKTADIKAITNMKYKSNDRCTPHREYYNDCNHCICDDNKIMVCTNKDCNAKSLKDGNELTTELPVIENENETCVPGQKYRFKCNTCTCTPNKELSCTTMVCLGDFILDGIALKRSLISRDTLEID